MIATYRNRPESIKTIYKTMVLFMVPLSVRRIFVTIVFCRCRVFLSAPKNTVVKNVSSNCDGRLTVICADFFVDAIFMACL